MENRIRRLLLDKPARVASLDKGKIVAIEFDGPTGDKMRLDFRAGAVPAVVRTLLNGYTLAMSAASKQNEPVWIKPTRQRVGLVNDHVALQFQLQDGGQIAAQLTRDDARATGELLREFGTKRAPG